MPKEILGFRWAFALLAPALVAVAGCGPDELESPAAKKLKGIANQYLDFAANTSDKRGPANEQAFKRRLSSHPDFVLNDQGFDPKNIDAAFVSDRDGEPFVILYGLTLGGINAKEAPLVAHEKKGRNGRFLVGLFNGKVRLVDEAGLQELKNPKKD